MNKQLLLILNNEVLKKYNEYYFKLHPKAHKIPIERGIHPSINTWMILKRPAMNGLKQKWKDMIKWWVKELNLSDMKLENYEMVYTSYMPTKRRVDPDNMSPKFIMDGFTEGGLIFDDDGSHCKSLTLKTSYDKENPRTEILITYKEV